MRRAARACIILLTSFVAVSAAPAFAPAFAPTCGCRLSDSSDVCVPSGSCAGDACLSPNNGTAGVCTNWEALKSCPSGEYLQGAGLGCVVNAQGYKTACDTGTCVPCTCATGEYASLCGSYFTDATLSGGRSNLACSPCTGKPANAAYTGAASPAQADACPWQCDAGYAGGNCAPCLTSCDAGYQLSGACTQTSGGADDTWPACVACNVTNAYDYSAGCTVRRCWPGYTLDALSNTCTATPLPPFPPLPPSPPPAPPPRPPPLYAIGAACSWDLAAHLVGISIPVNTTNASVLNDQKGILPGVMVGGAAVTGGELVLGGAGQYVSLPTSGLGTTKGFTLTVVYNPTSLGAQQVLAAFGDAENGGGLELGLTATGYPYVANRGELFTSAKLSTAGSLNTVSVVCAANRCVLFDFCCTPIVSQFPLRRSAGYTAF